MYRPLNIKETSGWHSALEEMSVLEITFYVGATEKYVALFIFLRKLSWLCGFGNHVKDQFFCLHFA